MQRKTNRQLTPITSNYSPDITSKLNPKSLVDTAAESYAMREFSESPDYLGRRRKEDEYLWSMPLSEINLELDNNMNELIFLLSRRKSLVQMKKRKVIQEMEERLTNSKERSDEEIANDEEFLKMTSFCENPKVAVKILSKILRVIPELKGPRNDEDERSEQFWIKNGKLENQIDAILERLKVIDKNLEKQNTEVHEICRELDRTEETLKSFVGAKSNEHVQKVEPLFLAKKKNYDLLNRRINDRETSKDKKIESIRKIKAILEELKATREGRVREIALFFGVENDWDFEGLNLRGDISSGIEEFLKIKEKDSQLQKSERAIFQQIGTLEKEQEKLFSELLRKQSDEAKAFHSYSAVMAQRVKYASMVRQLEGLSVDEINTKEIDRRFKDCKQLLERFLREDRRIKDGLVKTAETVRTFTNLLKVTENEKERRQELLNLLETCIRKRGEYEHKREQMRHILFEETKNTQELTQLEQDLEAILTDGDLDSYKRIGAVIGKCENQKVRLTHVRELVQKQMDSMDREVLSLANRIQEEYEDILCDVLPSDYQYSLKTGEDVKKLRNHLRKMYKRLGILANQ